MHPPLGVFFPPNIPHLYLSLKKRANSSVAHSRSFAAVSVQQVYPGDVVRLDGRIVDWMFLQAELMGSADPSGVSADASGVSSAQGSALTLEERFLYLKYW